MITVRGKNVFAFNKYGDDLRTAVENYLTNIEGLNVKVRKAREFEECDRDTLVLAEVVKTVSISGIQIKKEYLYCLHWNYVSDEFDEIYSLDKAEW